MNVVSYASEFFFVLLLSMCLLHSIPFSILLLLMCFLHLIPFSFLFLSMCVLYPIPFSILFLSMFLVHLIVSWLLLVISWLLDLITIRILSFSNYAHWLKNCFWLNNMYVLTGSYSIKWHGYVLTNQFDYEDLFDHMSNSHLVKFDLKKTIIVKKTMF